VHDIYYRCLVHHSAYKRPQAPTSFIEKSPLREAYEPNLQKATADLGEANPGQPGPFGTPPYVNARMLEFELILVCQIKWTNENN